MIKTKLLLLGVVFLYSSCRYSAPIIKFNKEYSEYKVDDTTAIKKRNFIGYQYFRISTDGFFGGYNIYKDYDANGKLVELTTEKMKVWGMCDGRQRTKMRTFHYENSVIYRKDYIITQAYGIGGRYVVNKTILINSDGKREIINNKKKN